MKKSSIILIITAFIVIGLVLGYFMWPKQTVENGQPPTNGDEIDTSNWKTYRSDEYGFEVRYPEEWIMLENEETGPAWRHYQRWHNQNNELLYVLEIKNLPKEQHPGCSSGGPGILPEGNTIRIVVKKNLGETFDDIIKQCVEHSEIQKCETRIMNISNDQALIIDEPNTSCSYPSMYIIKNDLTYITEPLWSNLDKEMMDYYRKFFYTFIDQFIIK